MEECITRLHVGAKQVTLIGTIHMSKRSVEQVKAVIETECPETVCVELDDLRILALAESASEADAVPADGDLPFLVLNTIIAALQKLLALDWGLLPGQDLLQAVKSAKAVGAQIILADCNIQAVFHRIWENISLKEKAALLARLIGLLTTGIGLSEADLENMKAPDNLAAILNKFGTEFPELKSMLIDERDYILAQNIKKAPGRRVVAVVGAAHVPGIVKYLLEDNPDS